MENGVTNDFPGRFVRRKGRLWVLVLLGIVASVAVGLFVLGGRPKSSVVWLPPLGTNQIEKAAPLVRFKNEYLSLIAPLWRPPARKGVDFQITERWMVLSAA